MADTTDEPGDEESSEFSSQQDKMTNDPNAEQLPDSNGADKEAPLEESPKAKKRKKHPAKPHELQPPPEVTDKVKYEREMKGLIPQEGETSAAPTAPSGPTYNIGFGEPASEAKESEPIEEDKAKLPDEVGQNGESGATADGKEPGTEITDGMIDYTEKEGRTKAIIIAVVAVIIIAVIAYVLLTYHKGVKTTTTITTTLPHGVTTTTTIHPSNTINRTNIINLNIYYNYTGPLKTTNNVSCALRKSSTVYSFTTTFIAGQTFYIPHWPFQSGACNLTVTNIIATTPGFRVTSIVPSLPVHIPSFSSVEIIANFQSPITNFTGPMSIEIRER